MAFDYTNLYPDTSGNGGYTKTWNYTTLDPVATVSAVGYFNKVATRLGIGDNIFVSVVDAFDTKVRTTLVAFASLYVSSIANGVVTTVSSATGLWASPALTGTPTAPTAAVDTTTSQIATTAFVIQQAASALPVVDGTAAAGTSKQYARADHVHPTDTSRAPLASPTFTGTPAAPTAAVDTNTTQIATTAMVLGQAASATPLSAGVAAVGTSTRFARADHVHPSASAGTTTNDNASAGNIGEYLVTSTGNNNASATVTMTIAAPAVVTWTGHGIAVGGFAVALKFTTTGALPTGVTSGTTYYGKAIDANTLNIATTVANALAGTFITTSGSQSGTHTADIRVSMTSGAQQDVAAISLTAGDWEVSGQMLKAAGATTTVTYIAGNLATTTASVDRTFGRRLSFQYGGLTLGNSEFTVFNFAPSRFSLSATTTVFLVADDTFGTSTMTCSGWLKARRAR